MKKLFVMSACLLALLGSPVMSYAADPEVVVVQVFDTDQKGKMVLTGPNGRSETIQFDKATTKQNALTLGQVYQTMVTKLYKEGYGLVSTSAIPNHSSSGGITTLIFTKGD